MKLSAALTFLLSICVGSYAELTIGSGQLNWHAAYMACRRQQRYLAIIDTPQKQLEAEQLIHKNCLDTHRFWITGTNLNCPNNRWYTWFTNGKQLAYSNWHSSSAPTENGHCVQLLGSEYGWKWTNMPCEHVHMYLCDDRISTICDTCAENPPPQPRPQPARRPTCVNCQAGSPDVSPKFYTIEGSDSPNSLSQSGGVNKGVAVTGSINTDITIN